ncbi:MAG: hypothetical protein WCO19_02095 [Candidatus Saccharibacteria bacterium]
MDQQPETPLNNAASPEPRPKNPSQPTITPAVLPVASNTPIQTPAPKSSGNKKLILIIVILVAVIVGGGIFAYFALNKDSKKSADTKPTPVVKTSKKPKIITKAEPNADYANCLRPEDYQVFFGGDPLAKVEYYDPDTEATVIGNTIFFKPDSTEYDYDVGYAINSNVSESLDPYGVFYKANKDKFWTLSIRGEIQDVDNSGPTASNKKLANDRADKIAQELISRGFDASRIKKLDPEINASYGLSDSQRNVELELSSQCKPDKNL